MLKERDRQPCDEEGRERGESLLRAILDNGGLLGTMLHNGACLLMAIFYLYAFFCIR